MNKQKSAVESYEIQSLDFEQELGQFNDYNFNPLTCCG